MYLEKKVHEWNSTQTVGIQTERQKYILSPSHHITTTVHCQHISTSIYFLGALGGFGSPRPVSQPCWRVFLQMQSYKSENLAYEKEDHQLVCIYENTNRELICYTQDQNLLFGHYSFLVS